jgi:hypothetical protein
MVRDYSADCAFNHFFGQNYASRTLPISLQKSFDFLAPVLRQCPSRIFRRVVSVRRRKLWRRFPVEQLLVYVVYNCAFNVDFVSGGVPSKPFGVSLFNGGQDFCEAVLIDLRKHLLAMILPLLRSLAAHLLL